jgi:large subunit ribosomal protein L10
LTVCYAKKKETVVGKLSEKLAACRVIFLTDFKGLKVDQLSNLRRKIREAGGEYEVAKNTLIRRAVQGTDSEPISDMLVGNNALTTTEDDPAALAKALVEFAKNQEKLVIKGGILAGRMVTFEQIKAIADLPGREVLLAGVLGAMNAVPTGMVRVLAALPQNLLYALAAIRDQKEENGS